MKLMMRRYTAVLLALLGTLAISTSDALGEVAPEIPGRIEELPQPFSAHWVWVTDLILERIALIDLDTGRVLGMINSGYGTALALFPQDRAEIYLPATHFSRRFRGTRTDLLEIWNRETLTFEDEVRLPSKRAIDSFALGHAALSDDDRFAAVLNWTPATSLSIVDVESRTLAAEIKIPGCTLAYAAGPRRFLSLCGDGAAMTVTIDDSGQLAGKERVAAFFDPGEDPVTEKAVRYRDQWIFVTFDGYARGIDVAGAPVKPLEPWSLLSDADRDDNWRIGGLQHLAVHEGSGRLYSLMHQGGTDTHKDPGDEVWVYGIGRRERIARIPLRHPGVTLYGEPIDIGNDWIWPFNAVFPWILDNLVPPTITHIQVTRDDEPLLFTASLYTGSLAVYDALSGKFVRRIQRTGWTSDTLYAPFDGD